MKSSLKFIPLVMLFAFLIMCSTIQANYIEAKNEVLNGEEMNVTITPAQAKMNDEVLIAVDLDEKYKAVNLIGIELWRVDDQTTAHQRIDVVRKGNSTFYYKTYFDMPGTYQINVHVLVNGVRKVTSKTFTVSV